MIAARLHILLVLAAGIGIPATLSPLALFCFVAHYVTGRPAREFESLFAGGARAWPFNRLGMALLLIGVLSSFLYLILQWL